MTGDVSSASVPSVKKTLGLTLAIALKKEPIVVQNAARLGNLLTLLKGSNCPVKNAGNNLSFPKLGNVKGIDGSAPKSAIQLSKVSIRILDEGKLLNLIRSELASIVGNFSSFLTAESKIFAVWNVEKPIPISLKLALFATKPLLSCPVKMGISTALKLVDDRK